MNSRVPLSFESDEQLELDRERLERLALACEQKAKELKARSRECNRLAWQFRYAMSELTRKAQSS